MPLLNLIRNNSFIKSRKFFLIVCLILIIVLGIVLFNYTFHINHDSDDAVVLLEAQSILKGNLFLKGWTFDSYIPIDDFLYIIFVAIKGVDPLIMHIVPIILYISTMIVAIFVAFYKKKKNLKESYGTLIWILIILGLPSIYLINTSLRSAIHMGSTLLALIIILLFNKYNENKKYYLLSIIFLLLIFGCLSDSLILIICNIPILLFSVYKVLTVNKATLRIPFYAGIAITILSYIISLIIRSFIYSFGFFTTTLKVIFIPLSDIFIQIKVIGQRLLDLYGVTDNYNLLFFPFIDTVLHLFIFGLALYIIFKILLNFIKRKGELDNISLLLTVAIILNFLSYFFSDYSIGKDESVRYLIPLVVFSAILIARNYSYETTLNTRNLRLFIIFSVLIIIFFINQCYITFTNKISVKDYYATEPSSKVINFLESHHLYNGFGSYWDSSITTVLTKNKITIRPLLYIDFGNNNKYQISYPNLADKQWYNPKTFDGRFYIYDEHNSYLTPKKDMITAIYHTFGEPSKQYSLGKYHIFVWTHNITKDTNYYYQVGLHS